MASSIISVSVVQGGAGPLACDFNGNIAVLPTDWLNSVNEEW